jgi:D-beta-D-heptose 7-phosphate kinase / D-beta-D-heptose 1-phosphate adenosyltransferase
MNYNFLVIGETCRDVFIYGSSKRLSPEAPVPVFTPEMEVCTHGMAKNVYYNLLSLVKQHSNNHSVYNYLSLHSASKVRYVDKKTNHYFLRVDTGDDKYDKIDFTDELEKLLKNADCVLISDYDKGFLNIDDIIKISKSVRGGCPIILDTKKKVKQLLPYVTFIKINSKEYAENVDAEDIVHYSDRLIVTLGENGTMYEGKTYPSPSPQNTIDVSGAGDTFMASFSFKYIEGGDIVSAINFANKCASEVVIKKGVATI